jgi:hypothetical protein
MLGRAAARKDLAMKQLTLTLMLLTLLVAACGPAEPTADVERTVAAALEATQSAAPSATPTPVPTNTDTPAPTPTPTAAPSETPTPAPSDTPPPSPTATEEPEPASGIITTPMEDGWVRYELPDVGVFLSLPPEWTALDLAAGDLDQLWEAVGELNPSLTNLMSSEVVRSLIAAGMVLYAIDTSPESLMSGGITNLNLLVTELPIDMPLDSYTALNIGQLESLFPDLELTSERVELGGREADKLIYTAEMGGLTGAASMQFTQYLTMDANTAYILTLTTPAELAEGYEPVFERIAESVRFPEGEE